MKISYLTLVLSTFSITSAKEPSEVQFDRDIRPILADKCFFCHGPDKENQEADLRLDLEANALAVIKAGNPDESELIARILATDEGQMPPKETNKELSDREVALLKKWVAGGPGIECYTILY